MSSAAVTPLRVPRPAVVVPVALGSLVASAGPGARINADPADPAGAGGSGGSRGSGGSGGSVTGMAMASDQVRPGDLFAGAPGHSAHGARYAAHAVAAGAVAVLTDAAGAAAVPEGIPVLLVRDVRAAVGPVASQVYGDPSGAMAMLGVTGTSGKTTTTFFVRAGLQAAGRVCGLIGTVATLIGTESIKTGFTTPEAPDLQALLAVMRERGAQSVAMEVSSHALAMGRADGIEFEVGAFTNLSQDHLDFHADMDDYFAAKRRLFDGRSRREVVMVDDEWGRRLVGPRTITVSAAAEPDARWQAGELKTDRTGRTSFRVRGPDTDLRTHCSVPGSFNVANALLALAILHTVGVPAATVAPAVAAAAVPGRMERIDAGQPFLAVVDYSHKPAAVDGALRALRPLTRGRLIIVLGCGGDRDRAKRPLMGELASRGSDLLIVTDDNPRSEDAAAIRRAMIDGAQAVPGGERGEVREVGDRAEAIARAVDEANEGDTVLVAGKGHESGQEIGGVVYPFDDRVVLRSALARFA